MNTTIPKKSKTPSSTSLLVLLTDDEWWQIVQVLSSSDQSPFELYSWLTIKALNCTCKRLHGLLSPWLLQWRRRVFPSDNTLRTMLRQEVVRRTGADYLRWLLNDGRTTDECWMTTPTALGLPATLLSSPAHVFYWHDRCPSLLLQMSEEDRRCRRLLPILFNAVAIGKVDVALWAYGGANERSAHAVTTDLALCVHAIEHEQDEMLECLWTFLAPKILAHLRVDKYNTLWCERGGNYLMLLQMFSLHSTTRFARWVQDRLSLAQQEDADTAVQLQKLPTPPP